MTPEGTNWISHYMFLHGMLNAICIKCHEIYRHW